MSDAPKILSDAERQAVFAAWLKPMQPKHPPAVTVLQKIAPWRHEFASAVAAGYTWPQLAKQIGPQPEIGVHVTGSSLRKYVQTSFEAAKEPVPPAVRPVRHRSKKKTIPTPAKV